MSNNTFYLIQICSNKILMAQSAEVSHMYYDLSSYLSIRSLTFQLVRKSLSSLLLWEVDGTSTTGHIFGLHLLLLLNMSYPRKTCVLRKIYQWTISSVRHLSKLHVETTTPGGGAATGDRKVEGPGPDNPHCMVMPRGCWGDWLPVPVGQARPCLGPDNRPEVPDKYW